LAPAPAPAERGPTLRLSSIDGREIRAVLTVAGQATAATAEYPTAVPAKEREDLRWYFKDHLEHPTPAGDVLAADAARTLRRLGERRFEEIFGVAGMRDLWRAAEPRLADVRVEVRDDSPARAILWEALAPPDGEPLALRSQAIALFEDTGREAG
jgi:hypothetical protein